MGNSVQKSPVGEPGGVRFPRHFERQAEGSENGLCLINVIWASFWTQII